MKIKPMDDRLLVQVDEEEMKTTSGIIIPDSAKEKPRMGTVVAVGTDEDLQEKIKQGNKVLFAKYGGEDISFDGQEYKIIQRSDILAVIEN
ncbi:MAG: co-chaperone GroES [Ignavibacteriae bacterium HGW-Ignavibacteriae-2]|jgi:chaperonin GroES|nr:MAG: co-chaperone GroES [Ignavibacteriae bacterium HGW-Ignavibacteriae-2]